MCFARSPDGLAAGEELDPLLDVVVPEPLPEPVLPDVLVPEAPAPLAPEVLPAGALPPELVVPDDFDEPALPAPLVLDCAAAMAGAKAMTATTRTIMSFRMLTSFSD